MGRGVPCHWTAYIHSLVLCSFFLCYLKTDNAFTQFKNKGGHARLFLFLCCHERCGDTFAQVPLQVGRCVRRADLEVGLRGPFDGIPRLPSHRVLRGAPQQQCRQCVFPVFSPTERFANTWGFANLMGRHLENYKEAGFPCPLQAAFLADSGRMSSPVTGG